MWTSKRRATDVAEYDAFYRSTRNELLLQTFALTGDASASHKAVRDTFVVAWHHWAKVGRLDGAGRMEWVRPLAWSRAQRRHTARMWARADRVAPEHRSTLDALAALPADQRRLLLLVHLAEVDLDRAAREIGMTRRVAERRLQSAVTAFALGRRGSAAEVREPLVALRDAIDPALRWPRGTILTRAGAARRRTHTMVGTAATVLALGLSGVVVTDTAGVRPVLADKGLFGSPQAALGPAAGPTATSEPDPLPETALLAPADLAPAGGESWSVRRTTRNTEGNGLVFPCQEARYADPAGLATYVRTFGTDGRGPQPDAVQAVEVSRDERRAKGTVTRAQQWFAGCTAGRMQLLSTDAADGIGDQAALFSLRSWTDPVRTHVVGVARTGAITTTFLVQRPGEDDPDLGAAASMLAAAVSHLCELPAGGSCVRHTRTERVDPIRAGRNPAMLQAVDLPPIATVEQPWVGTPAEPLRGDNLAATRCDSSNFGLAEDTRTRTFLVPGSRHLPPEFGLTQTTGSMKHSDAVGFVARVRDELAACPETQLGTEVIELASSSGNDRELAAWRVTTEIGEDRSVDFLMAVLRRGTSVSQIGFVPAGEARIGEEAFVRLAERALGRLAHR